MSPPKTKEFHLFYLVQCYAKLTLYLVATKLSVATCSWKRKVEGLEFAMEFLEQNDIVTVPDYLSALGYLDRGPLASDQQWPRPEIDFFDQTGDREPLPELFHEFIGHYLDGRIVGRDDRPIRGTNRLYAIGMVRSEGWAPQGYHHTW